MEFQTPPAVCDYMASFLPEIITGSILEPTPGEGNIVSALRKRISVGAIVAPERFEELSKDLRFDWVVMNPPFTPMKVGYQFLEDVMKMSDNIIALLPWFILINSERRLKRIKEFGLKSVTHFQEVESNVVFLN